MFSSQIVQNAEIIIVVHWKFEENMDLSRIYLVVLYDFFKQTKNAFNNDFIVHFYFTLS